MDNGASSYRRFLEGDESAFDEIVDTLFHKLVFFVNGFVHDYYASEDIAIEAISDLFVNKGRYNFRVSLKTYLFLLGKRKALNYLKHQRTVTTVEFSEMERVSDDSIQLEEKVLLDERARIVRSAIEKLPGDMQMVIHLIYFEDMTQEEASKVIGKTKKQVYNLAFRAKTELREILGEQGKKLL